MDRLAEEELGEMGGIGKRIYTAWTCDEWKSYNSMRLLMATTSVRKLRSFVARKIADETFIYNKGNELTIPQQVKLFRSDFENSSLATLNDGLHYGFLDDCNDGEAI